MEAKRWGAGPQDREGLAADKPFRKGDRRDPGRAPPLPGGVPALRFTRRPNACHGCAAAHPPTSRFAQDDCLLASRLASRKLTPDRYAPDWHDSLELARAGDYGPERWRSARSM